MEHGDGCVENRWKCKQVDNDEQDWSSMKSTPITEVSNIYVCKGKFYKTFKELTPIPKLFHTIVKKVSAKHTLWAILLSYQKKERTNKGKWKLQVNQPKENILNKMLVQLIHKHIKIGEIGFFTRLYQWLTCTGKWMNSLHFISRRKTKTHRSISIHQNSHSVRFNTILWW
jgi:hypothetical protein